MIFLHLIDIFYTFLHFSHFWRIKHKICNWIIYGVGGVGLILNPVDARVPMHTPFSDRTIVRLKTRWLLHCLINLWNFYVCYVEKEGGIHNSFLRVSHDTPIMWYPIKWSRVSCDTLPLVNLQWFYSNDQWGRGGNSFLLTIFCIYAKVEKFPMQFRKKDSDLFDGTLEIKIQTKLMMVHDCKVGNP